MDAVTCTELKTEQALAKRWLRTRHIPLAVWQWLCGRHVMLTDCLPPASPLLVQSLQAFAEPLGSHSNTHEKQSLDSCLASAAQLVSFCHQHASGPALVCQHRMLAACMLPLYRGLARGSVAEVTTVLRRQLADAVTLAATLMEFREELPDMMCHAMADDHSPYKKLADVLQVELERLAQVLLAGGSQWDGNDLGKLNTIVREEFKLDWRPAWGQPAVLWRLAGELIAKRAEFVVPRDWIDVPVPWNDASEHWLDVVHALEQQSASQASFAARDSKPVDSKSMDSRQIESSQLESNRLESNPVELNATNSRSAESNSTESKADMVGGMKRADGATASGGNGSRDAKTGEPLVDDIQRLKLEIEIADTVDSLVQASRHATGNAVGNRTDGSHPPQTPRPRSEEFVIPKIIIAEVRSHNDPAFVSVVRRQLALCRSEERAMSLLAVKVSPDGEEGNMPTLQSLGLASWQQKLVNWMSEHPEIRDPYAFVSNEGELILSLMDLERNSATLILRQGLMEVLSGGASDDGSLGRAPAPARYHAGIGSVSSPTASFEPEQLIEATYRCLDAATRHGKASIKSIEVF